MAADYDTEVLIVGAGPVGLVLAIDLGQRGIRCTLIERKPAPQFLPKMERCNARTMEIFRRMGIAERVRAAGLRADCPMDVFIIEAMNRAPLLHLPYPSVDEARRRIAACNDGSMPLEPYQLISQYTLEPLLKSIAESLPSVTVRFGHEFISFEQDANGVTTRVRSEGKDHRLTSKYLVGCDGGSSAVRRQLGIKLEGEANILKLRQALYRCDELFERIPLQDGPGHGRHYHVADDKATFLIMQDSTRHWTLHATVDEDAAMARQFEKTIGVPVKYEMLYVGEWRMNLLLADRYGEGRVFLAGDAIHLVIPTGGLGMNGGVGDAIDLGWKLAAQLRGWGGPRLLASYEIERRQVGERNVAASRYASQGRRKWRSMHQAPREELIAVAAIEQPKSNEMIGAELGYRYEDSPLICNEPGGPEHRFRDYVPTTWPGARLPHVWLAGQVAMQDRIGDGYTLLRLGENKEGETLKASFARYNAPFAVLDVPDDVARDVYGYDLILVRPDLHIVWRGNRLPHADLAAIATGHA
ncbi:MAG TPA: FAD-dependent monooxygenase [Burkholderiales bacterium]|nr:FAD-dependent monooxygenase [Burkholderiales bacterium]